MRAATRIRIRERWWTIEAIAKEAGVTSSAIWKRIRAGRKTATKASQRQRDWHAAERARGALTLIAGEDFAASIEGFQDWYRQSGLARRVR